MKTMLTTLLLLSAFSQSGYANTSYRFTHAEVLPNSLYSGLGSFDWGFMWARGGYLERPTDVRGYPLTNKPQKNSYRYTYTSEEIKARNIKMSACEKVLSGNLFYGRKALYSCFVEQDYNKDLTSYQQFVNKLNAKKWGAKLTITGLDRTSSALNGEIEATGFVLDSMLASKDKVLKSIVKIDITQCMDADGNWHTLEEQQDKNDLDIESLIDRLYETSAVRYLRCDLGVSTNEIVTPILEGEVGTRKSTGEAYDSTDIKLQIDEDSKYILVKGIYTNYRYELEGAEVATNNRALLQKKIADYIDFLKYDYGDVLLDLFENDVPRAELRLKIEGFFQKNESKIKTYLKEIRNLSNKSELIDQVSATYSINRAYEYIRQIEKKMRARMTLDNIVSSNLD